MTTHPNTEAIAVPITCSGEIDIVAARHKVSVIKTRGSHLAMMEAASDKRIKFIGGTRGGFIFTDFFFATDAMYSLAKILEMISRSEKGLADFDATIPHLAAARRDINCSWEHKGKVMRYIMRDTEGFRRDLVDGVKVYIDDQSSVLLLPDKERPLFHIIVEALAQDRANRLADEYERKLIQWRDQQ
jgi:mannose-1-phosphate guanylyltransferase / phosphomannomutase